MNNEGKLDDIGSGHVMAYINDPSGRIQLGHPAGRVLRPSLATRL